MGMENSPEIKLSDFGLITALVTVGIPIRRTEKNGRRIFFVFADNPKLQSAVGQYWNGELRVQARNYFDNSKMIKAQIYST